MANPFPCARLTGTEHRTLELNSTSPSLSSLPRTPALQAPINPTGWCPILIKVPILSEHAWLAQGVKALGRAPSEPRGAGSCCLTTSGGEAPAHWDTAQLTNKLPTALQLRGWPLWAENGSFLFCPLHPKLGEKQA